MLATKGHIKDLPPKKYGIDIENGFLPTYEWLKGKKAFFSLIKKAAKSASVVYIASDPDREGEMIAEHISEELHSIKAKIYRIRLLEISKTKLKDAISAPDSINQQLVNSQVCRRLIDRIFGFEISPVLWRDLKIAGLSAGRVQSAVLKWICARELEIRNFIPEDYVLLSAVIDYKNKSIDLTYSIEGEEKEKLSPEKSRAILKKYGLTKPGVAPKDLKFTLIQIDEKDYKYFPPSPFTTASLQETAAKSLGLSASQTMRLAQNLYEGKSIHGEMLGLITYMRSDSTRVSEDRRAQATKYLKAARPDLKLGSVRGVKGKLHAQEAHEAIVPTRPQLTPEELRTFLSKDEFSLYQLIWQRLMISLLEPELGIERNYIFEAKGERWHVKQKTGKSLGYKAFQDNQTLPQDDLSGLVPGQSVPCRAFKAEEKKTTPKERYTEGQIIAKMESTGIGRPSTYSQILETLRKRKYILEIKKKLGATALGEKVNSYLVRSYADLIGEEFTKKMEDTLDNLAQGIGAKLQVLEDFYKKVLFLKKQKHTAFGEVTPPKPIKAESVTKKKKPDLVHLTTVEKEQRLCPVCGEGHVRSKFSKKGKTIYFCSRYPNCDFVSYDPLPTS